MKLSAQELGFELRDSTDDFVVHRRAGAVLALVSMTSLAIVALYQFGVLKRLPEPPLPGLDAEKVNGSKQAYQLLNNARRSAGHGQFTRRLWVWRRWAGQPARKRSVDSARARREGGSRHAPSRHADPQILGQLPAFSLYSLITATATFLTLPTVLPEAYAAWRKLVRG